jgi:hypothetical protein
MPLMGWLSTCSARAPGIQRAPKLASAPKQIDLLSAPDAECLLALLGSTSGLPPGKYQQIRIILVANDASGVTLSTNGGINECAGVGVLNCVAYSSDTAARPEFAQKGED